jgi:hypothetical protein
MNPHRPHDQRGTAHWRADEATMATFTVRLPRWPVLLGLTGRKPLVRTTDRIEALVFVLAVVVSLLTAPIAAAVGTAVYDSSRHIYAEQAQWTAGGTEHVGAVTAQSTTEPGDHVAIWVDNNGALTDRPTPTTRAGVDAVTAALFMWAGVTAAAAILFAGTRAVCDRIRAIRWQNAIDTLVGSDPHKPS